MTSVTDLEIINSIVRIEKLPNIMLSNRVFSTEVVTGIRQEYNPLINKALLLDLILKHKVCIDRGFAGADQGLVEIWPEDMDTCALIGTYAESFGNDDEFPLAVLLVIIQANPSA